MVYTKQVTQWAVVFCLQCWCWAKPPGFHLLFKYVDFKTTLAKYSPPGNKYFGHTIKLHAASQCKVFCSFFSLFFLHQPTTADSRRIYFQTEQGQAHARLSFTSERQSRVTNPNGTATTVSPLFIFYQMWISPAWKQTVIWICEASPVNLDCTTPKAPRRDGVGEEKCTEDDVCFIGPDPHCELAKHERKIQGMKLATASLLCDLSPWTSLTPRCAFFFLFSPLLPSFCISFHCRSAQQKNANYAL